MNEQAIRFRIGIFVLAALILLGVLIILFGDLPNFFKKTSDFSIAFDNAQGIAPGTPVKRSGVKIGDVRSVTLNNATGQVEVHIQIDEGFTLRKGDRPTLIKEILSGDTSITFLPPPEPVADTSPLEPGTSLVGYTQADLAQVVPSAQEALDEVRKVFQKIDKDILPEFKKLGEFAGKVEKLLPTIDKTFTDVNKDVIPELVKVMPKIDKTFDEVNTKLLLKIDKAFDEVNKSVIPEIAKILPKFDKTIDSVNKDIIPEFRKTNDELQVTIRNWGKVGERADNILQANEDKLTKTLDRVQDTLKRMSDVFNDENQRSIRDILKNSRTASDRFDSMAKNADDLLKEGRTTLKRFSDSMSKVEAALDDVQKATKPFADRSDNIAKNIDESTDKLNRTLGDVREMLQAISRNDGTIQRLLSDPALYNNLNDASCTLTRILPRVDRIMRDVEIFSDKIARHPNSLVFPDIFKRTSGLKEAPTPYGVFPMYP